MEGELRDKERLLEMTKISEALGKKPADGKTMFDEPTLFIDLFETQNKMVDNFKSKCLESNIKWLSGLENYVKDKERPRDNKLYYKNYKKGSIIFVDFFGNFGNEYTYNHPAIVLKENRGLLVVAPMTSNPSIYNDTQEYHIKLPANEEVLGDRKVDSTILLEQIRTISKNRVLIKKSLGRVTKNEKLKEIDNAIIKYLAGFSFDLIKQEMKALINSKDNEIAENKAIIEKQKIKIDEQEKEILELQKNNF